MCWSVSGTNLPLLFLARLVISKQLAEFRSWLGLEHLTRVLFRPWSNYVKSKVHTGTSQLTTRVIWFIFASYHCSKIFLFLYVFLKTAVDRRPRNSSLKHWDYKSLSAIFVIRHSANNRSAYIFLQYLYLSLNILQLNIKRESFKHF